jgi:hypothetical protein
MFHNLPDYMSCGDHRLNSHHCEDRKPQKAFHCEVILMCFLYLNPVLQISQNELYISMVENVLNTSFLYFSYSYDITHTLQRLHNTTPEFLQVSSGDVYYE